MRSQPWRKRSPTEFARPRHATHELTRRWQSLSDSTAHVPVAPGATGTHRHRPKLARAADRRCRARAPALELVAGGGRYPTTPARRSAIEPGGAVPAAHGLALEHLGRVQAVVFAYEHAIVTPGSPD